MLVLFSTSPYCTRRSGFEAAFRGDAIGPRAACMALPAFVAGLLGICERLGATSAWQSKTRYRRAEEVISGSLPPNTCSPPVIIGGIAGSGTRVAAALVKSLGFQLHGDHNLDCCPCTNPHGNWSNLWSYLGRIDCTQPWAVKCPDFLWRYAGLVQAWPGAMLVQVVRDVRDIAFDPLPRIQYSALARDYHSSSGVVSPTLHAQLQGLFPSNQSGTPAWKASVWTALNLWAANSLSASVLRLEDTHVQTTVHAFREKLLSHAAAGSPTAASVLRDSSVSNALDRISHDLGNHVRVASTNEPPRLLNHSWASGSLCLELLRIRAVEAVAITAMRRLGYQAVPGRTCQVHPSGMDIGADAPASVRTPSSRS